MDQIAKDVNIGEEIRKKMAEKKVFQKHLATFLKSQQPLIHKLLTKKSIDTEKLVKISNFLGYNFFKLYCQDCQGSDTMQDAASMSCGGKAKRAKVLDNIDYDRVSESINHDEINKILREHNDSLKNEVEHLRQLNNELLKENRNLLNVLLHIGGLDSSAKDTDSSDPIQQVL